MVCIVNMHEESTEDGNDVVSKSDVNKTDGFVDTNKESAEDYNNFSPMRWWIQQPFIVLP